MFNNPSTATNPATYIAELDEPRRSEVQSLYDLITQATGGLESFILSGMIGFGRYHYKYPSGREGEWFLIGLASRKTGISIYVCALEGDKYLAELHKDKLGKAIVGKSCIRVKKLSDLNLDQLRQTIKQAVSLYKQGKAMGQQS